MASQPISYLIRPCSRMITSRAPLMSTIKSFSQLSLLDSKLAPKSRLMSTWNRSFLSSQPSSLFVATSNPLPSPILSPPSGSSCSFMLSLSPASRAGWQQRRFRDVLAPKKRKFRKSFKGRIPVRTGGSTKGNNVLIGDFGLRAKAPVRFSANQLVAARTAIRRHIKSVKGARVWLRVFPDIPVSSKGNECRMGKGKGAIDFYACRVPLGKMVFEVGGEGLREEVAREALRIGAQKLPIPMDFVIRKKDPFSIAKDNEKAEKEKQQKPLEIQSEKDSSQNTVTKNV